MQLKDFIRDTLVQIVDGVIEAQGQVKQKGAIVAPDTSRGVLEQSKPKSGFTVTKHGHHLTFVEFDVALTEADSTATKGGIGVLFGAINLGSAGESSERTSSLSRIKFEVPIVLPVQR